MLDLDQSGPKPKCLVTTSKLPSFVDHQQPPTKKRPFTTVLNQSFSHSLEFLLPESAANTLQNQLSNGKGTLTYCKVYLKPIDIITGAFFTTYIKSANSEILLLSSGSASSNDPTISLADGILRLEVDKSTFQRLGLQGKPIPSEGRKHVKARYAIETNLRAPNMVQGKPGFERLIWAFKNVLNDSITSLFCDLKGDSDLSSGPLAEHHPKVRKVDAQITRIKDALVPVFPTELRGEDYADAAELLEWLSLATSLSPRVQKDDSIDSYLSRYRVPADLGEPTKRNLVSFRWRGLIPPSFAHKVLLAAIKASGDQWMAMNCASFEGESYTILLNQGHAFTWEYKD